MRILFTLITTAAVAALAASTAGCNAGGADGDGAHDVGTTVGDRSTAGVPADAIGGAPGIVDDGGSPSAAQPEAAAAVNDFAAAEVIEPGSVTVVEVKPVTWPDSALGCPSPGEMYTQALVPGYEVRLSAGNKTGVYHTNRGKSGAIAIRRCGAATIASSDDPVVLTRIRADLAGRIAPGTPVVLERSGPVAATTLVCPGTPDAPADPSASTLQLAVSEALFRVGSDRHAYRVWNGQFIYCGIAPPAEPVGAGTPTVATS